MTSVDTPSGHATDEHDLPPLVPGAVLRGADLSGRDLSGIDLTGADLSLADLTGVKALGATFTGAALHGAKLDGANLMNVDLTDADVSQCSAVDVNLGGSTLVRASLFGTDLSNGSLSHADLTGADLRTADLTGARLRSVTLIEADLTNGVLTDADLTEAVVTDAVFRNAHLSGARFKGMLGYRTGDWVGADTTGTDFTGAFLARRYIIDQNYLHEFRTQSPTHEWIYRLWWLTSDCGRSMVRWGMCTLTFALIFAGIYEVVDIDYGDDKTALSSIYFSIVTLTTLGYGDILPNSQTAQAVVIGQVIVGYGMLGGLLSIFSTMMSRRGE